MNLGLPPSIIKDIKKNYWSSNQRRDAYIDEYTHNHPCPSWKKVADVLRDHHSLGEQADEVEKIYVQGMIVYKLLIIYFIGKYIAICLKRLHA